MIKIQLEIKKDNTIELTAYEARDLYNALKEIFEVQTYTYPTIFESPQNPLINPTMPYYTQPRYCGTSTKEPFIGNLLKENKI